MTSSKVVDIYSPLSIITPKGSKETTTPDVQAFFVSQLTQTSDARSTYDSRVKGRHILLENPVKESRIKREREEKKVKRKQEIEKRKRKNGVGREDMMFKLDPSQSKFDLFLPLHHLWLGYMSELLSLADAGKDIPWSAGMHPRLVKADFHGSIMTVRQSRNTSQVGLSGIVLLETENAFRVITRANTLRMLVKQNTVFAFSVPAYVFNAPSAEQSSPELSGRGTMTVEDIPHLEFQLYGNQFRYTIFPVQAQLAPLTLHALLGAKPHDAVSLIHLLEFLEWMDVELDVEEMDLDLMDAGSLRWISSNTTY